MPRYTTLSGGVLHLATDSSSPSFYDESTLLGAPVTSGTPITLPAGQTYSGDELEVFFNGERVEDGVDYEYVGSIPRTQISFNSDLVSGDRIRFRKVLSQVQTIYDSTLSVGTGGITSGTAITLPGSETYTSDELELYLNGSRMEDAIDYNYVASPPRTQITVTFDLVEGDRLRFRKAT